MDPVRRLDDEESDSSDDEEEPGKVEVTIIGSPRCEWDTRVCEILRDPILQHSESARLLEWARRNGAPDDGAEDAVGVRTKWTMAPFIKRPPTTLPGHEPEDYARYTNKNYGIQHRPLNPNWPFNWGRRASWFD